MQSITVDKENLFVFHFYDIYLEIERKGEATQKIAYEKLKSCETKKGKPEILSTIFVAFVSLITGLLKDIKVYKEYDQLLIELKNKKILVYQINKGTDKAIIDKIINLIREKTM